LRFFLQIPDVSIASLYHPVVDNYIIEDMASAPKVASARVRRPPNQITGYLKM
jgi:hypothetical protein